MDLPPEVPCLIACPACGGRLRFIVAILKTDVIKRILEHLGLGYCPVVTAEARSPPEQLDLIA